MTSIIMFDLKFNVRVGWQDLGLLTLLSNILLSQLSFGDWRRDLEKSRKYVSSKLIVYIEYRVIAS